MKCTKNKEDLDAFLDSEMDSDWRVQTLAHLENCAECREELQRNRSVSAVLKEKLPVETRPAFDEKVLAAMAEALPLQEIRSGQRSKGIFGFPRLAFAGGLLAILLSTGLAFQLGRMSAGTAEATTESDLDAASRQERTPPFREKFVKVPVVKEKIVEVPVIRERVVTRTIYVPVGPEKAEDQSGNGPARSEPALQNAVRGGEYLTQTDLDGFVPVAKLTMNVKRKVDEK